MLKRLLQRRRAKSSQRSPKRLANPESLEMRALLTATPIGEALAVGDLFTGAQRSDITSVDTIVSGEQQATIVFHGHGINGARLAGTDREIFYQQFENNVATGNAEAANQITRGEQYTPRTDVATDGSFWIAWSGRGEGDRVGIYARRFDAAGTAIGDQIRINTTRGGDQTNPDVAVADDGSAVVVWHGVGDGDFDGVFAQRISASGELVGSETLINQTTDNMQVFPTVSADADGSFVVAWSSRHQDGDDWGIFARQFNNQGIAAGDEFQVNTTTNGSQHRPSLDMDAEGGFTVSWSSLGQDGDQWGVFARQFDNAGAAAGDEIQLNSNTAGSQRDVRIAASDAGEFFAAWNDYQVDGSGLQVTARTFNEDGVADSDEIEVSSVSRVDSFDESAPGVALNAEGNSLIAFSVRETGDLTVSFAQPFEVDVQPSENASPVIEAVDDIVATVGETITRTIRFSDRNRMDQLTIELEVDDSSNGATLTDNGDNTATLVWQATGADRLRRFFFEVTVIDDAETPIKTRTAIQVDVVNAAPVVDLNVNGELRLDRGEGTIDVGNSGLSVTDGDQTELSSATISLRGLVDNGQEILSVDTSGTQIQADYDSQTGRLTLTGADSVASYQTVLQTLTYANNAGESRTSGLRNLDFVVFDGEDNSQRVTATVRVLSSSNGPELVEIADQTLLSGSPLHIPLNGIDPNGDTLTYTIESSDSSVVSTNVLSGNRSLRLNVQSPGNNLNGDLVFELFEGRARRATDQIIGLAEDGFYDGLIFHRIIDNFVIQGGDPLGNGTGGSELPDFDDQFHVDLQHNRAGLLSMAKSADDTNNSQFFVTDVPTRNLDANHTVFGVLVEGEGLRDAINSVPTGVGDLPLNTVTIADAEVFVDNQNGVLVLSAPEGTSGEADITVTVSDGTSSTTQTFKVTVTPDTTNTPPWLGDIPVIATAIDTPVQFQLQGIDIEGDPIRYFDPDDARSFALQGGGAPFPVQLPPDDVRVIVNNSTGVMNIIPSNGFTGTFEISVVVGDNGITTPGGPADYQTFEVRVG